MQVHFDIQNRMHQLGELGHRLQIGRFGYGHGKQSGIIDQIEVVLFDPVLKLFDIQCAVANASHEG